MQKSVSVFEWIPTAKSYTETDKPTYAQIKEEKIELEIEKWLRSELSK